MNMKEKLIILLVTLLLATGIEAQSDYWTDNGNTEAFAQGNGTLDSPYLIQKEEHLAYLALQVNNGNGYEGAFFRLMEDLDLSEHFWVPIGNNTTIVNFTNTFQGHFDGNGRSIDGLYIGTQGSSTYQNAGLFGYVYSGSSGKTVGIENLTLKSGEIATAAVPDRMNNTGALIGYLRTGANASPMTIRACINEGVNVTGIGHSYHRTGGLIGGVYFGNPAQSTLIITACKNKAEVTGETTGSNASTGGIIGYVQPITDGNGILEITECSNEGIITGGDASTYSHTGGIVGFISCYPTFDNVFISSCSNKGNIEAKAITGKQYAGGLVGRIEGFSNSPNGKLTLSDCYSNCTVTTTKGFAGGIIGEAYLYSANQIDIKNVYAAGKIEREEEEDGGAERVGGLIGVLSKASAVSTFPTLSNSLAAMTSLEGADGAVIHRIVGGIATDSYTYLDIDAPEIANYLPTANHAKVTENLNWTAIGEHKQDAADWDGVHSGLKALLSWDEDLWEFSDNDLPKLKNPSDNPGGTTDKYTVTLTDTEGINYNYSGATEVNKGNSFSFTIGVGPEYDANTMEVWVEGKTSGNSEKLTAIDDEYTITNIQEDVTVTVIITKLPTVTHTVNLTIPVNGLTLKDMADGEHTVNDGDEFTVRFTIDPGWENHTLEILVDGQTEIPVKGIDDIYTLSLPTVIADMSIIIKLSDSSNPAPPATYHTISLTLASGIGCEYTAGELTVAEGDHLYFLFWPENPAATADDILFYVDGIETTFKNLPGERFSYILNPIDRDYTIEIALREYPVTLPQVENAHTDPVAGTYPVGYGTSFRFILTLDQGIAPDDVHVYANGTELHNSTLRSNILSYTISEVTAPVDITIEGTDNPTGNQLPTSGVDVTAEKGRLKITNYSGRIVHVAVYNLHGQLVSSCKVNMNTIIDLPPDVYVVKTGTVTTKIIIK